MKHWSMYVILLHWKRGGVTPSSGLALRIEEYSPSPGVYFRLSCGIYVIINFTFFSLPPIEGIPQILLIPEFIKKVSREVGDHVSRPNKPFGG
jgi:hypothetical protein